MMCDKNLLQQLRPIHLLGFYCHDNGNDLGEVLEVIEHPHQLMCRIQYGDNDQILIPINEQSLVKVTRKIKTDA
jgi:16S rRNA processing protein RimM